MPGETRASMVVQTAVSAKMAVSNKMAVSAKMEAVTLAARSVGRACSTTDR